jgi:hypothetical protein
VPTIVVAYDFVYDPEGRELTIAPNDGSTDPADYPNQLTRTSELFSFLAAHLQSTIAIVDLKTVLQSYPLSKLMLQSWTIEASLSKTYGLMLQTVNSGITSTRRRIESSERLSGIAIFRAKHILALVPHQRLRQGAPLMN